MIGLAACGGETPPPAAANKPAAAATPPVDTTAVPLPAGLLAVGRIARPDAVMKVVAGWAKLPLPGAAELVRSISDDAVADAVDAAQPIDGAAALGGSMRDPKPLVAISLAVTDYEAAKVKLSAKHRAKAGPNGTLVVAGIGLPPQGARGPRSEDDEEDEGTTCVLGHAPASPTAGRLVCGEPRALQLLAPYLTRTVTRQQWPADVHVEMTLGALKDPVNHLKGALPFLARSMLGSSSPAAGKLIESAVGELVDIVNDTSRVTLDAQVADAGLDATMKVEYAATTSLVAQLATSHPERADAPPPAFLHLPGDTDLAVYGKGAEPKLFDHTRELLGNVALEATEGAGMPDSERKAVRELVIDRMMTLFTGPIVYGKGFDTAALDKALAARRTVKVTDFAAADEADRIVAEQMIGWHLVQVGEPITKVAPILKDWAGLWNRPAFSKWAKAQTSGKMLAQMRMAALPAGVVLPKESMHLEIVIPRAELVLPDAAAAPGAKGAPPKVAAKPRTVAVKPLVMHVMAVPDQGGTWIGFAMDAKLLGAKAAASLSSAPDGATLGKSATADALKDVKANGAALATLRGLAVFSAMDKGGRSSFDMLAALPARGQTPVAVTFAAQPPTAGAAGGSAVVSFKIPKAVIEDAAKLGLATAR
ncbi:MAG: hypothetical protein JWP97_3722 [Labilithrix sp.]|nr:hypothetical protein [Labilithrix sp.]